MALIYCFDVILPLIKSLEAESRMSKYVTTIYPATPMEIKTTREELRELKKSLYRKSFGPPYGLKFDNILRRLQLHRRGLFNFPKIENSSYGCI